MLSARKITVRYGPVTAVDEADIDVAADEVVALLGRSGSGKTSLLLAIAGVVPTASGTVELDGRRIDELPTHRRDVGVVFQDFALFPHLTVGENVGYGVAALRDEAGDRVREALAMVDLTGYESRRIDELSGGQAQRVALARTLATRPRALLLDEPLGSLDPALRSDVAAELAHLLGDLAIPTVLVTHDTAEAFALGGRIVVLDNGRIAGSGPPDRLWEEPGSVEIARMLGHRAVVTALMADGMAHVGDVVIPIGGVPDGEALLLVRPGATRQDPTGTSLPVVGSRFAGPGWITTVALGDGALEVATAERHAPGTFIGVTIDPDGITPLRAQ